MPPPPPGFGFINVRLVDEAGKPHGYGLIGPEVLAYPARKDICSVLPRTGMGTVQDTLVESWRHANRDGLAQLTVKIPGAYFIFVGGDEHSFWWDGQKNCLNATPLQVDGTINLDVVY